MADDTSDTPQKIAAATQRALIEVALQAYEEAGLSGLCAEGRWEVAIGAMRSYDVRKAIPRAKGQDAIVRGPGTDASAPGPHGTT